MIETIFLGIVVFLCVLAVFDLVVGVSNDAVNFINSAIGAKAAPFKVIIAIAAVGVFAGASMSNGMMDVARHGIFTPQYFTFYEVMCIFLAVMVTDVVLLDVFNSLGMPTSTTVSMVFELLGGAFALALVKMASGGVLGLGELLNTDKALSVIIAIFMSVAVAFVFGLLVMWMSRMVFTFVTPRNRSLKTVIFGSLSATAIIWFLLINGLKGSSLMTPELKASINDHTWLILAVCFGAMTLLMTVLALLRVQVLRVVVMMGTFALAMAFAGNDLVNFVGVPLTGLDAYLDFMANGQGDPNAFLMASLQESAKTPVYFLLFAGLVMVLSLVFSKKAQNVVKTSVDLSRQDEGDEMFGSSGIARVLVRQCQKVSTFVSDFIPKPVAQWVDSRFNADSAVLAQGAAFDQIRASVNLVLAGLLVAFGTSMKLPLSTTYVTFMVAMGTSLADRAWSRESAVFRITGVLSVIGGWFITAGAAFVVCYLMTNLMFFGSFIAMGLAIVLAIFLLVRSNIKFSAQKEEPATDRLFKHLLSTKDKNLRWDLLKQHVALGCTEQIKFVISTYEKITDAFLQEEYRPLRHATHEIETARKQLKRQRRREIIGLRKIDPMIALEKNTWYFLSSDAIEQLLYCMKRINDPCREHVGNNFSPVSYELTSTFLGYQKQVIDTLEQALMAINSPIGSNGMADVIREQATIVQQNISDYRKQVIDMMQQNTVNIASTTAFLNILQESQQILSCTRHMLRGLAKFNA